MESYLPVIAVFAVILAVILFSVQYTLNLILKEIRSIRLSINYDRAYPERKREYDE